MTVTDYVFLDTETTGLDDTAEIIEIAIAAPSGEIIFQSYCKPTIAVSKEAADVHGIEESLLNEAPCWSEISEHVQAVLSDKNVVIFNKNFDIRLLKQTAEAQNLDTYWISELRTQCAMERAVDLYGPTNNFNTISLEDAAFAAGMKKQGRQHSAAGDAATTALLWKAMDTKEKQQEKRREANAKRRDKKLRAERESDAKLNNLTLTERESLEKLQQFVNAILAGKTLELEDSERRQLKKMGFDISLIPAKKVAKTKRGKSAAFPQRVGGRAQNFMRGIQYRAYMPWQIREFKEEKKAP